MTNYDMSILVRFQSEEKQRIYFLERIQSLEKDQSLHYIYQFLLSYCDKQYSKPSSQELPEFSKSITGYINTTTAYILDKKIINLKTESESEIKNIENKIAILMVKTFDKKDFSNIEKILSLAQNLSIILKIIRQEDTKISVMKARINEDDKKCKDIFSGINLNESGSIILSDDKLDITTFTQVIENYKRIEQIGSKIIFEIENDIKEAEKEYNIAGLKQIGASDLKKRLEQCKQIITQTEHIRILTEKFEQAYLTDNQKEIEQILKAFPKEILTHYYVVGNNYSNFVYHSLSNSNFNPSDISKPKPFGDTISSNPRLSPKEYAVRLQQFIISQGYISSGRQLRNKIVGIRSINNIFVYFEPVYLDYSMALVAFKPKDLCLVEYTNGIRGMLEGVIFTKNTIHPSDVEIYVRDSSMIKNPKDRKYASELLIELKKLNVPVIIDSKSGNLH
ncbi:MAG: hypothetical protein ACP5N1_06110 [Candidatus Woesearchaeota archaeon]